MIRTKGEAGTGNVVEAVRHTRSLTGAIRQLQTLDEDELYVYAKEIRAPVDLVRKTKHLGRSVCRTCISQANGSLVRILIWSTLVPSSANTLGAPALDDIDQCILYNGGPFARAHISCFIAAAAAA